MPLPIFKSQTNNLGCTAAGSSRENIHAKPFFERDLPSARYTSSRMFTPFFHYHFCLLLPMGCLAHDLTRSISKFHLMHNIVRKPEYLKQNYPILPSLDFLRYSVFYGFVFQTPGPSCVFCALHSTGHGSRMKP